MTKGGLLIFERPMEGTFTEVIPVDELSESLEPVTVEVERAGDEQGQ